MDNKKKRFLLLGGLLLLVVIVLLIVFKSEKLTCQVVKDKIDTELTIVFRNNKVKKFKMKKERFFEKDDAYIDMYTKELEDDYGKYKDLDGFDYSVEAGYDQVLLEFEFNLSKVDNINDVPSFIDISSNYEKTKDYLEMNGYVCE